jgi:hypothetical protein
VPLTAIGPDKTGQFDFCIFEQELSILVRFVWQHILVTLLGNQLLQAHQAWRVETPTTIDPTTTRATFSSPPSTP